MSIPLNRSRIKPSAKRVVLCKLPLNKETEVEAFRNKVNSYVAINLGSSKQGKIRRALFGKVLDNIISLKIIQMKIFKSYLSSQLTNKSIIKCIRYSVYCTSIFINTFSCHYWTYMIE